MRILRVLRPLPLLILPLILSIFLYPLSLAQTVPHYAISRTGSFLVAITGKTGLFSFAAHRHAVTSTSWSANLKLDPVQLTRSNLTLTIPAASLVIDDAEVRRQAKLDSGPNLQQVVEIQKKMLSPEFLDPAHFPTIEFISRSVHLGGTDQLEVTGDLTLHGQTRAVTIPVRYRASDNGGFLFTGEFTIRQTDFALNPPTVGLGTVKVKDEVSIQFQFTASPQP
jgi:polyisoprenoid-binding protein YceI